MESCNLSAKKLHIIAGLLKKAKQERVSFSLNTSTHFPEPIYQSSSPSDTLNLKDLQEKLLLQTDLIAKLSKALAYCHKQLKAAPPSSEAIEQLKGLFKRKQNKVAHVLKKTLAELKSAKEQEVALQTEIARYKTDNEALAVDQHRLADGLERALQALRLAKQGKGVDLTLEKKKIEEHVTARYKAQLDEAEKKIVLLEARIKKDEETTTRLKKGFEDLLASVKRDYENQLAAKDASFKTQEEEKGTQAQEVQDYKKQVALLKAHLEGILIDKKKIEQTLKTMRQSETAPLEHKLKELDVLLQTKEDELTYMQRHLGKKIQEIAGLQELLQEQEAHTEETRRELQQTLHGIEELKADHQRNEGLLAEEIASLNDLIDQKSHTIDSLQQEIARLKEVEDDFDRMKESISLLQQNLLRSR